MNNKIGVVGEKYGMTSIFCEDSKIIPVTIIKIYENQIVKFKNIGADNYKKMQIVYGIKNKVNKSKLNYYKKYNTNIGIGLFEFFISNNFLYKSNDKLNIFDIFKVGQYINVISNSKGKGFAGVVKKYHFSMQRATHGNSLSHRVPGSIGQCQFPGKVFKGKKMAGHMGNKQVKIKNIKIVKMLKKNDINIILLYGAVPGYCGSVVKIVTY